MNHTIIKKKGIVSLYSHNKDYKKFTAISTDNSCLILSLTVIKVKGIVMNPDKVLCCMFLFAFLVFDRAQNTIDVYY